MIPDASAPFLHHGICPLHGGKASDVSFFVLALSREDKGSNRAAPKPRARIRQQPGDVQESRSTGREGVAALLSRQRIAA
jgi:hypothetical protein